jgi:hypothetical protein
VADETFDVTVAELALPQGFIGHLLKCFEDLAALRTLVFVDRHGFVSLLAEEL